MKISLYHKMILNSIYVIIFSLTLLCCSNTICFQSNIVTFDKDHSTYVIKDVMDLKGKTLTIPKSCTLTFDNGKIINGLIVFNNTKLLDPCFENCRFDGSVIDAQFNIQDFGAKPNIPMDCSLIINDIIKLKTTPVSTNNPKRIYFPKGVYNIYQPIELFAGFESPVTLCGEGNMSNICQNHDNDYIIKVFEQNHIKDLMLSYKNPQTTKNTHSIAIACQRSIYSIFENLTICKAYTGFGYISINDQNKGNNPTQYIDQCYVSDNFRNIRIYEFSGYAFDFKKEIQQGDSGSAFDNIYISNSQWLGKQNDNFSMGAIRGENTVASFSQLNIEGSHFYSSLIDLSGFSRISIQALHVEGQDNIPTIVHVNTQSIFYSDIIDIQLCKFKANGYNMFVSDDLGAIMIQNIGIRPDCNFANGKTYKIREGVGSISIGRIIDGTRTVWK